MPIFEISEASVANYGRRLFIVFSFAVFWALLAGLLAFHPQYLSALGRQRMVLVVLSCLCVQPILFFPWAAKRAPAMKTSLILFSGFLVLTAIKGIAFAAFNVDNIWTDGIGYLGQGLIFAILVISIWRAMQKRKEQENNHTHL